MILARSPASFFHAPPPLFSMLVVGPGTLSMDRKAGAVYDDLPVSDQRMRLFESNIGRVLLSLVAGFFDKASGVGLVRVDGGVGVRRRRGVGGFGWISVVGRDF